MNHKQNVTITLGSTQDGESIALTYSGEWFVKEKSFYLRYAEQTELGEVRNLLRYQHGLLSHSRKGAVESEQIYAIGIRRSGYYDNKVVKFELDAHTSELRLLNSDEELIDELPTKLPFTLEWTYDLYVGEQLTGQFSNRLIIQEG